MQLEVSTTPQFESRLRLIVRQEVAEMMQQQPKQKEKVPSFLNLGESASFIHVSRGTLNKLIKQGDIQVTFIGSAKRISKDQLIEYMASKAI